MFDKSQGGVHCIVCFSGPGECQAEGRSMQSLRIAAKNDLSTFGGFESSSNGWAMRQKKLNAFWRVSITYSFVASCITCQLQQTGWANCRPHFSCGKMPAGTRILTKCVGFGPRSNLRAVDKLCTCPNQRLKPNCILLLGTDSLWIIQHIREYIYIYTKS